VTKTEKKDIKPFSRYREESKTTGEEQEWEKARGPEYKEYRKEWIECPKKMKVRDFPIHLDIETTNACNLKCAMCPRTVQVNEGTFRKVGYIDFDFYKSLIDQGAENKLRSVKLSYLGEPLMHPDVVKQVKYAKEKGIIEVMFNTNAVLLTEEMSRDLLNAGLDSIFFSFDSMDPEKYNKIRIGADFHKVMSNIKRFVEIKNELGCKKVQTRCSLVIMDQTAEDIENYKKFWLEIVDKVGFGEWIDPATEKKMYENINPNFVCNQVFQRMFVLWDGTVTPCCRDDRSEYILGDAKKEKLKDLWLGENFKNLRELMVKGEYYKIPICRKCYAPWAKQGDV